MFIQMLKKQTTFVSSVEEAEKHSPFRILRNPNNGCWIVKKLQYVDPASKYDSYSTISAGMDKEEADACVMFKANEYIYRNLQDAK